VSVAAIVPLIIFAVAWIAYCLVDLFRSGVGSPARWWWAAFIVLSVPIGGLVWLFVGRSRS
jgi:hypothetical protein